MATWYLEGYFSKDSALRSLLISKFPASLGRDPSQDCVIDSPMVSRCHALLSTIGDQLLIEDMNSSNGTHVNRVRITEKTQIRHGDIIHLGDVEFRLIDIDHQSSAPPPTSSTTQVLGHNKLSESFPSGVLQLEALIADQAIAMEFQPVLDAKGILAGYEALGRGASTQLSSSPFELFRIAESVGLEIELSELMRNLGVRDAANYGLEGDIYINTHPSEMKQPHRLISSLSALKAQYPQIPLVFEVHEQCVTDIESLRDFRSELRKLSIRFAFDDFGVGQSRLMELLEARPDLVKFDKVLIQEIDSADQSKLNLIKHLNEFASDLSIATLAECVETEAEFTACKEIGFDLYQGYYFCKPQRPDFFK